MRRPWRRLVVAGISALVLLAACNRHAADSRPPGLEIQLGAEPVSLDPALAEDGISLRVLGNVMEGLVAYDGGGTLRNALAEKIDTSEDGRRYEFTLRKDAAWSDGRPVAAQDFVTAFRRALAPTTLSKLAGMLFPIRGARTFHAAGDPSVLGVHDVGGKLVIELERATSYFLQTLTLPVALPAREDFLASHGGSWTDEAPVTGPYRIVAHQPDQMIRLEPNPKYWDAAKAKRVPVVLRIVSDESTAVSLFERGQLDILTKVPTLDLPRLRKLGVVHDDPLMATYFLSFNLRKPPFDNRDWRRAVAGAIRREELASALGSGEPAARSWVPVGLEGFIPFTDPGPVFADSLAKVRAELRSRPFAVSASFDSSSRNTLVMEKVQHDLLAGLGIRLVLSNLDWKTYVRSITHNPSSLFRYGWLAPFRDPITHLQAFVTGDPNNFSGWSNAEYDRLVAEISALAPGPAREAKVREAETIVVDREAAVVPLFHYLQTHAVAARVTGFRVNAAGVIRFDELGIKL